MNDINLELSNYIKSKNGLVRMMKSLKDKYVSLSRVSGTIYLSDLSDEEKTQIGNLLGRRIKDNNIKISFKELTRKINEGKFNGFEWIKLFKLYFNDDVYTKKEQREIYIDDESNFYKEFIDINRDKLFIDTLINIINTNESINRIVKKKYNKNKTKLKDELQNIILLLNNIPTKPIPLAVYSSKVTGNPHYLDLNKSNCTLFLKILSVMKDIEYEEKTETKINILSEINVYTDPISNYVITYKLMGNNILNKLNKMEQILNLNLLNINKINKVYTKINKAFIFENPSILNSLMDLNVPIIITSGMPNLSFYTLINKLVNSGTQLYYNGDFDPEGLLIANKLKEKYPSINLFCYDEVDYKIALSKEKISESRLKKLDNVKSLELINIKELMKQNKLSAYQEQNLERIRDFIKSNY